MISKTGKPFCPLGTAFCTNFRLTVIFTSILSENFSSQSK